MVEVKERFTAPEKKRIGSIEEEISALALRKEAALRRVRETEDELARVDKRQGEIALAVVSEDPAAVEEDDQLADDHVRATRNVRVARSAVEQAEKGLSELASRQEAEEKAIHEERHDDLARKRYKLEQKLEKQLDTFLGTVAELDGLDAEQDLEKLDAGMNDHWISHRQILTLWLEGRLGGSGKLLPGLDGRTNPEHRGHLCDVDPRASKG